MNLKEAIKLAKKNLKNEPALLDKKTLENIKRRIDKAILQKSYSFEA